MRKAVYKSSEDEGRALFARAPVVHLATTGEDGRPILRAVHAVLHGDVLAFHGAPAGEKMEGLGRPAVMAAHEVVAEIPSWFLDPERACPATTYYVSVQADGVLEEIHDLETKARILQELMTKYQPEGGHVPIRGDDPMYTKAVNGLLVACLRIERLACKAKLGQNRRPEERSRVLEELWRRGGPGDVRAVDLLARRFPEVAPQLLRPAGLHLACAVDGDDLRECGDLLEGAYWLAGVERETALAAVERSDAVVLARDAKTRELVAFARAVSDGRVAWIYDVIVRAGRRGAGAGTAVMQLLIDHPAVRNARHVRLTTKDAMPFYRRFGFVDLDEAPRHPWPSVDMLLARRSERTARAEPGHTRR